MVDNNYAGDMGKQAVVYLRVSSEDQVDGNSQKTRQGIGYKSMAKDLPNSGNIVVINDEETQGSAFSIVNSPVVTTTTHGLEDESEVSSYTIN